MDRNERYNPDYFAVAARRRYVGPLTLTQRRGRLEKAPS